MGKTERLKSRKVIEQLFTEGKSFSNFPFRVVYILSKVDVLPGEGSHHGQLQATFSVPTKFFKKAVDRNRVKRLMREAYRLQKNVLSDQVKATKRSLHVFIIYTGKELPGYQVVFEKTAALLKWLLKYTDENLDATA